ncbi:MAG: hypothetical protein HQL94_06720, partial [Magnetococcales bacterium]|nr:hypothetical protein [Magnetococcales bacterium]
ETLYDFIPTLKETLNDTLPRIQDEIFEPLLDIWNRFPHHCKESGLTGVDVMERKLMDIEKRTLEIWGVSQFLGPDLDEKVLIAVTNKNEIDEMARTIVGEGEQSVFVEKLRQLDQEMQKALKLAREVESAAIAGMQGVLNSVMASRDEINQALLKINLWGLEMKSLPLPPQTLLRSLARDRKEIDEAPRLAAVLLGRIEAILHASAPYDEDKFAELYKLEGEAKEILEKVRKVMRSLDKPSHIDRYSETELSASEESPSVDVEDVFIQPSIFTNTLSFLSVARKEEKNRLLAWGPPVPKEDMTLSLPVEEAVEEKPRLLAWGPPVVEENVKSVEPVDVAVFCTPVTEFVEPLPLLDGSRMVRDLRTQLEEADQHLMRIQLHAMELRRKLPVNPELLHTLDHCSDQFDLVSQEIEAILQELQEVPETHCKRDSQTFHEISALQKKTYALFEQVAALMKDLDMTPPEMPHFSESIVRPPMAKMTKRKEVAKPLTGIRFIARETPAIEIRQEAASFVSRESLLQRLRDDNMQLRHELRPLRSLNRPTIPVALITIFGGLWYGIFI